MNILQILQHMMKLSANLIKFIFTQAMKYSLVINWQLEGKIVEYLLTNFSKVYVIQQKTAILKRLMQKPIVKNQLEILLYQDFHQI